MVRGREENGIQVNRSEVEFFYSISDRHMRFHGFVLKFPAEKLSTLSSRCKYEFPPQYWIVRSRATMCQEG